MFGLALHGESKGYLFLYYLFFYITYIYNVFFLNIYMYMCVWPHISIHIYICIIYTYVDFLYTVCTYSSKLSRGFAVNVEQDGLGNVGSEPSGWQKLTKEMVFVDHIQISIFIGVWTIPKWLVYGIVLPTSQKNVLLMSVKPRRFAQPELHQQRLWRGERTCGGLRTTARAERCAFMVGPGIKPPQSID